MSPAAPASSASWTRAYGDPGQPGPGTIGAGTVSLRTGMPPGRSDPTAGWPEGTISPTPPEEVAATTPPPVSSPQPIEDDNRSRETRRMVAPRVEVWLRDMTFLG